jgi:hypothetical protein
MTKDRPDGTKAKPPSTTFQTGTFREVRALGEQQGRREGRQRRQRIIAIAGAWMALLVAVPLVLNVLAWLAWRDVERGIMNLQYRMEVSGCCDLEGQVCTECEEARSELAAQFAATRRGWRSEASEAIGAIFGRDNIDFSSLPTPSDFAHKLVCQGPPPPPKPVDQPTAPLSPVCTEASASRVSSACVTACDPTCNLNDGFLRCFPAGLNWSGDADDGGIFHPTLQKSGWRPTSSLPTAMRERLAALDGCIQRCCAEVPTDLRPVRWKTDTGYDVAKANGSLVLDVLPRSSTPKLTYTAEGKSVMLDFNVALPPARVLDIYARQLRAQGVVVRRLANELQSPLARVWATGSGSSCSVSIAWHRRR